MNSETQQIVPADINVPRNANGYSVLNLVFNGTHNGL